MLSKFGFLSLIALTWMLSVQAAQALPAFAIREKLSCTMCHANGSFPHLTKIGFLYRRAGFRFPGDIGNEEKDNSTFDLTHHMAAGANIDYQYTDTKTEGQANHVISNNNVNVREVEIWPLVGAFHGNIGAWTEVDFNPGTDQNGNTPGAALNQGDLRYVIGDPEHFYSMRAGLMAPEGFGASDQWLDDGNIPLFEQMAAYFNQNTLANPFGAMEMPQMGLEFGYNTDKSFFTFSILNGFTGVNATTPTTEASDAIPATHKAGRSSVKDYKFQWDQFVGDQVAFTLAHYIGDIPLITQDGAGGTWYNGFQNSRLYLSYFPTPDLELLTGAAYGKYDYVTATSGTVPAGHFSTRGGFAGFMYHARPHLSFSARYDYMTLANGFIDNPNSIPMNRGVELMMSLPYEHSNFVFHIDWLDTNSFYDPANPGVHVTQNSYDARAEWRFLF